MTASRGAAGLAATITAVLLQATLVGPVTLPWAVSLPAVLVAATALLAGPATGTVLGFTVGLVTDLAGDHRVGVLALSWLLLGIAAGMVGELVRGNHARRVSHAAAVAVLCAVATLGATCLDAALEPAARADLGRAAVAVAPGAAGDAVLAFLLLPLVGWALRSPALRPAPVFGSATR